MTSNLRVAVIGLGIAGNARVRDIPTLAPSLKGMEHISLAGFVSRRSIGKHDNGAKQLPIEDVLCEGNDIDAVIISTENATHEQFIRQALAAKKHVCVDFPLVPNADKAKELFELAKKQGVVLYEEDIALLTDRYEATKDLVQKNGKLVKAQTTMTVGANGWIENLSASGSPFHTSMDILNTLVDFFGDLTPVSSVMNKAEDKTTAEGKLKTKDDGEITITFNLVKERMRKKTFSYTFENGEVITEETPVADLSEKNKDLPKPLFMRDVLQFAQTVAKQRSNEYNEWLTVRCLEIADQLHTMAS